MNNVCLIGRLTRDVELRTTNTGKSVASFSIAVQKRFKRDGEADADFFRVTVWEQSATYLSNYGYKGARISVIGRLETRKYTDNSGNEREIVEIQAEQVRVEDSRRDGDNPQGQGHGNQQRSQPARSADEYDPFADD